MIDPRIQDIVLKGTPAQRQYIFSKPEGFPYFAIYYWPEFFHYKIAEFQWDMYSDLKKLTEREIAFIFWLIFRESAKTTLAKMYACYCGVTAKKRYINFDSYEKENAEASLFDIAVWLQTNEKLISDYGQLFFEPPKQKKSTVKRVNNFVLGNGVKYEAFSTQEGTRGRIYQDARPDLFIIDDFETSKTIRSNATIQAIIAHLNELIGGLAPTASVIFLGNYISESGVVQYILDKAKDNPRFLIRKVNVEEGGKPVWEDKYAMTDLEAGVRNVDRPNDAPVVSLESKKRDLGEREYAKEMMNSPETSGDLVFDRAKVEAAIEKARGLPVQDRAGFKVWKDFNPAHLYCLGADTAQGVGRDSSASFLLDVTPFPNQMVGSYANNLIAPDTFAHELKRQGEMFGTCLIGPEINNQGWATVNELKRIYPIEKIYRKSQQGRDMRIKESISDKLGWDTNAATKPDMIYQFKRAFEDGHVEIFDLALLDEMRRYNQTDLSELRYDPESTRHFDKLMAACITWAIRTQAVLMSSTVEEDYQQPAYEASSEYEQTGRSAND